jgi:DNA (cytosine-5)-methyltransferase 1
LDSNEPDLFGQLHSASETSSAKPFSENTGPTSQSTTMSERSTSGGGVDVITSGDPCQRDSRANARRDGGSMWPWTLRQVQRHRPLYVIRENVLGNIDTGTLEQVEGDLIAEGYAVRSYIISASAIGAAHDRPRTWTLAYSDRAGRKKRDHAPQPGAPEQRVYPVLTGPDGLCWMGSEPPVLRRIDDVPRRVDRIRSLGNAVVPQVVEQIGKAILNGTIK